MEFLFGLTFTLLKVSVQASVYATLILILTKIWGKFSPSSRLAIFTSNKKRVWWCSGFAASMTLFLMANTHWGNHGLGDYARIPLGHGLAMEELNGNVVYFEPLSITEQSDMISEVDSYQLTGDILCGKMNDSLYFTYNLDTKQHSTFTDSTTYNATAKYLGLPTIAQFQSFNEHYIIYWEGWRFWLLA